MANQCMRALSSGMFFTSPFQSPPPSDILFSESYGFKLHFLAELLWVVDSSSVYEVGLFHVFGEVFWFEFLEFFPFCYEYATFCIFRLS